MPTVSYHADTGRFERRIDTRQDTPPLEVTWICTASSPFTEWTGRIENASVTGASVFGPVGLPVEIGAEAKIRFEDDSTVGRVCRSARHHSSTMGERRRW